MQRQVDPRLSIVVEGNDEFSVLTGHIDEKNVLLVLGGPKPAVMRAAELFDQMKVDYAIGLIDRDLDDLTGESRSYPSCLVVTSGYDLATDVLDAELGLLRRAAVAHAGVSTVDTIERTSGLSLAEVVYALSMATARLRLVNAEESLGLNLRDFPFHDVIASDYAPATPEDLLDRANSRSAVPVAFPDIESALNAVDSRMAGNRSNCGGHDVFGATAAVLRKAGASKVGATHIAASVFTAVSCTVILSLSIYAQIEAWASAHSLRAFTC